MFGRWWRTLITVALVDVGIWLGAHQWLWRTIDQGWGENGWVTGAVVVSVVGIPVAIFLLVSGAAARVGGGRAVGSRGGSSGSAGSGTRFYDYGSESNQ